MLAEARAKLDAARQDLILRVAQAYFDVLQAQENLVAARAFKQAVGSQLDIALEAFEVGTLGMPDVEAMNSLLDPNAR